MSTIFRTSINFQEEVHESPETTHLFPSETQPDEVLSIAEMLSRHVRGLPVDGEKTDGQYYPPEMGYIPDLKELDLTEMEEYRDYYAELVTKADEQIKKQQAEEAEQAEARKKEEDEDKALLKSLRNNSKPAEGGKPQKSEGQ